MPQAQVQAQGCFCICVYPTDIVYKMILVDEPTKCSFITGRPQGSHWALLRPTAHGPQVFPWSAVLLWLRELWAALLIQYLLKLSHFLHTEEAMVVGNKIRLTAHAFTDPDGHPDRQEQWEG